jgi:hypothetical protein
MVGFGGDLGKHSKIGHVIGTVLLIFLAAFVLYLIFGRGT